jgi:hypothetical protein
LSNAKETVRREHGTKEGILVIMMLAVSLTSLFEFDFEIISEYWLACSLTKRRVYKESSIPHPLHNMVDIYQSVKKIVLVHLLQWRLKKGFGSGHEKLGF